MDRTARLVRVTLVSLAPPPDATIVLPEAADDEPGAEVHPAAAIDSSPTETGRSRGGGFHHLQGGAGRRETHTASEHPEPTGRAASDRDARKTPAAVEERHPTDGCVVHRRVHGGLLSGQGRQETRAVAELQETAASDREVRKNLDGRDLRKNLGGDPTDRCLVRRRAPGGLLSGGGWQDARAVAELQESTTPATSARAASKNFAGGLGGLAGPPISSFYNRYDQYSDLYLYGRPVSDFWYALWTSLPLVLHDRELLSIRQYIAGCRRSDFTVDLTNEITSILHSHPGPVRYFRIDSCSWTGGSETLGQWLETLSSHTVHELTVVNTLLPATTEFPIQKLQGPGLTVLSLAFLDIPDLFFGRFNYCTLETLQLTGCTYSARGLQSVVAECTCLRCLLIGCSSDNIIIVSQSLMSIQTWNCKASFLSIEYAPKLLTLSTGIRPKDGLQSVMVSMNAVEALAEIRYIMLPFHDLTIRAASAIEGKVALPQVRTLGLGIQMGSSYQRGGLVSILKHMPRVANLILSIVEDSPTDEEYDGSNSAIESLSCVQVSLQSVIVDGFRGGRPEVAVIASILKKAGELLEVVLEPICSAAASEAAKKLEQCPRASVGCRFIVTQPD